MAMEIKQQLRMAQQLKMTPQLQQAIKLLQLSRMDLVDLVQQEMEENPMLEDGLSSENPSSSSDEAGTVEGSGEQEAGLDNESQADDKAEDPRMADGVAGKESPADPGSEQTAASEYEMGTASEHNDTVGGEAESKAVSEIDWDAYLEHHQLSPRLPTQRLSGNDDLPPPEANYSRAPSLSHHLAGQLNLHDLDDDELRVGLLIIGNLDARGYLSEPPLQEIADIANVSLLVAEDILFLVQTFDPLGVGARTLQECLMIQAKNIGQDDEILTRIVQDHLSNLERKNYRAIAKDLGQSLEEIIEAVKVLATFNPRPGRLYSEEEPIYIVPDVYVHKVGDEYHVVANDDGLPKLRISGFYRTALAGGRDERRYVQERLRSAQWLIRSIHQRQRTIYKVTESIVRFQKAFFDHGVSQLRPLILRDVADDIGMHESTVSRVTSNKYVHTHRGIFELKFFFNSSISRRDGADIASESVKKRIREIIGQENEKKPVSDQRIVEILRDENVEIARRTVAKYREQMNILSSSKRKRFF